MCFFCCFLATSSAYVKFPGQGSNLEPQLQQHQIINLLCHKRTLTSLFALLFRAASVAYGGSRPRDRIRAYATATATQDASRECDLHHSSWQCRILNPLSEARDGTCILVVTSQAHKPLSHKGKSLNILYFIYLFYFYFLFSFFVFLPFLGPLSWHMEVPRLGVQLEL